MFTRKDEYLEFKGKQKYREQTPETKIVNSKPHQQKHLTPATAIFEVVGLMHSLNLRWWRSSNLELEIDPEFTVDYHGTTYGISSILLTWSSLVPFILRRRALLAGYTVRRSLFGDPSGCILFSPSQGSTRMRSSQNDLSS